MIKINVTESASLVTEHLENTLSPSFFSTFCYVTVLFQNGWNQFFTSKFFLHNTPIMNMEKNWLKFFFKFKLKLTDVQKYSQPFLGH